MDETIFQLRFTAKQLERLAKKAEKDSEKERAKAKKALQQRNVDHARVYAQNTLRKKSDGLGWLRMASHVSALASKVQSAGAMKGSMKSLNQATKALDKALGSMDLKTVSAAMKRFETQAEDLDVHASVVEDSMAAAALTTTPQGQVDDLMRQMAEESGLDDLMEQIGRLPAVAIPPGGQTSHEQEEEDDRLKIV